MLIYGGGSRAAARRAARFGMGFFAQTWAAGLEDTYRDECERLGQPVGMCVIPAPGTATTMFVADDVDRAWERIGPFMLHDARMYASWLGDTAAASKSTALTIEALRAEGGRLPHTDAGGGGRVRPRARRARARTHCAAAARRSSRGRRSSSSPTRCCPPWRDGGHPSLNSGRAHR